MSQDRMNKYKGMQLMQVKIYNEGLIRDVYKPNGEVPIGILLSLQFCRVLLILQIT